MEKDINLDRAKDTLNHIESKLEELRRELLWQEELATTIRDLVRRLENNDIRDDKDTLEENNLKSTIVAYMESVDKLFQCKTRNRNELSTSEIVTLASLLYDSLLKDVESKELAAIHLGVPENFLNMYYRVVRLEYISNKE